MSASNSHTVPPNAAGDVASFARMLVAAARTWQMYSPDHPASLTALDRLARAVDALQAHSDLTIGVTPVTLMVNGAALARDVRVTEAAAMLHDHDVLRLRFPSPTTPAVLSDLLRMLIADADAVRALGGPAKAWAESGHQSVEIDQINFEALMADRGPAAGGPPLLSPPGAGSDAPARADSTAHDDVWESIVSSMSSGRPTEGSSVQQRLLEIARSTDAIESLAREVAPLAAGKPQSAVVAAQAATVLTTFRRLVRAVEAQSPDEKSATLRNLAEAASRLDPQVVMRAVAESTESGSGSDVTTAMGNLFDDDQVARMLARSLAAEGKASGRIAAAFSTLAPDPARQQQVLRLARARSAPDIDEGAAGIGAAFHSLEQMLSGPGDVAYTSTEYSASLDDAESRSHQLRLSVPPQMDEWMRTVSSDSIRSLSSVLLLDLFALEERQGEIVETADDLAALAEDLLMSADTVEADRVVHTLDTTASDRSPHHAEAGSKALETIARSTSLSEMSLALADFDSTQLAWFGRFCHQLGPAALESLVPSMLTAPEGEGRHRLDQVIVQFGDEAVAPLTQLIESSDRAVCRAALQCIGRIGTDKAIAVLQKLIGGEDVRTARDAVVALVRIDDSSALRPVIAALRDGPSALRHLVVDALAASRERRAAPLLAATLDTIDPLGPEHELAIRVLRALRLVNDDAAVPAIARTFGAWSWLRLARASRVKRTAAGVLASMKTDAALAALDQAVTDGDVLSRGHARLARGTRT
ncbi:MAG: HEAT repeat domain-containing protein [Acidobacteria bacterium]|nr:HEAT repeat domain-containing protein [Acidobacteriota bacterium]